jgi:hypothetical protein
MVEQGQAQGPALREEADPSGQRLDGRELAVHPDGRRGVGDAHAIRPDEPQTGLPADLQKLRLPFRTGGSDFGEPGTDHDQALDALARTFAGDRADGGRGDGDDRQVDRVGDVQDTRVGAHALHGPGSGIDRMNRTVEAAFDQVVEQDASDGVPFARGTDDGDRSGLKQGANGGGRGDRIAPLESVPSLWCRRCRDLDTDGTGRAADGDGQPALAEYLEHRTVLGEHDRLQRRDTGVFGDLGQPTEELRPQTSSVDVVADRDGELREVGREQVIAGLADDPVVRAVERHEGDATSRRACPLPRDRRQIGCSRPETEVARPATEPLEEVADRAFIRQRR